MISDRITYLRVLAAPGRLEEALRVFVAPVLRNIQGSPMLDAGYFSRYQMEALLFIVGDPQWLAGVRADVEQRVDRLLQTGLLQRRSLADYHPEYERYGGEEGMRLAARIFQADSLSCLELLDVEDRGLLAKSRREYSLLLTDRLLDMLGFDRTQKIAFYKYSYSWAIDRGQWQQEDLCLLEERYEGLKVGLAALFEDRLPDDDLFGGAEAARVAHGWIERTRPLIADLQRARSVGRVSQDIVPLAWSYTHMQCNRLGITGEAEAVLRFFMQRLHEDGSGGAR
jgi:thiopeptide-type bacteriocin biosynthesis protein